MPRTRATVCRWRASNATRTVPRLSAPVDSVIVPTYNEAASLPLLVARLAPAMRAREWELVVVDDGSPDGTADVAEKLGATHPVRVVRRSAIDGVRLNAIGFKIGFEVIARANARRIVEVPYTFRDRELGASKFGRREIGQYLLQLGIVARDKVTGKLR